MRQSGRGGGAKWGSSAGDRIVEEVARAERFLGVAERGSVAYTPRMSDARGIWLGVFEQNGWTVGGRPGPLESRVEASISILGEKDHFHASTRHGLRPPCRLRTSMPQPAAG